MSENFGFTKLIVGDLESSAAFYREVFGLEEEFRVTAEIGGRVIHEIMHKPTAEGAGPLVLLTFDDTDQPVPGDAILGFITDDVDGLVARAVAHGAAVVDEPHDLPEHFVRVGFVTDPEGHLLELVQVVLPESS